MDSRLASSSSSPLRPTVGAASDQASRTTLAGTHTIRHAPSGQPHRLSSLDWLVIAAYAVAMLGVGLFYSRKNKNPEDYLLGRRRMSPGAVGLSLFATLLSSISYLAYPGEVIQNGPMILGMLTAYPVIAFVVGRLFIPYLMRLRVTSAYEILEARFGVTVRLLGSVLFLLLRLMWMAVIVHATTDKVLIPLTGLDPSMTPYVAGLVTLVTMVYTSMGGLRAVVFTDVVQTGILLGGAILSLVIITWTLGGVTQWWPTEWAANWPEPEFGFTTDSRITLGWLFLSTAIWYVCTSGSDQMAVQRYLATRDPRAARRAYNTSLGVNALVLILLAMLGFALLAFFRQNPHLFGDEDRLIENADQLFPKFIVLGLPSGISGLVIAGLMAAAMSSLSSGLNSSCSVIYIDWVSRFRRSRIDENAQLRLTRWISLAVGTVVVMMTSAVAFIPGNLIDLSYRIANLLTVPLFILFFMAMFIPWATTAGTWLAALASTTTAILISFWQLFFGSSGPSILLIMPGALLAGIIIGVLGSLLPVGLASQDGKSP